MASLILGPLKKKLGPFLYNFDEKKLDASLLSSGITLKELVVRPDKINDLLASKNAPFMLKAGMIGKIQIKVLFMIFLLSYFSHNLVGKYPDNTA